MKEIAEKIIDKIEKNFSNEIKEDYLYDNEKYVFSEKGKQIEIKKNNFLNVFNEINKEGEKKILEKKIAFIDGGFCEILKTNSFGVFFNRIYYTIYQNNKRIENKFFEFFNYVYYEIFEDNKLENNKQKIFLKNEIVFFDNKKNKTYKFNDLNFCFDAFDKKISLNNNMADISIIGDIIRRFAEIKIINYIDADFIIVDGCFDINYPYEKEIVEDIIKQKININKKIFGLSKTNNYITKSGFPFSYYILNIAKKKEKNCFLYYLEDNETSFVFFIKTNEKSDYVFRLDFLKNIYKKEKNEKILEENKDLEEICFLLKENSKDPVFLGYPYGLIDADIFARISNKEKEQMILKFFSVFGKNAKEIKKLVLINKTHDILDKLRF